MTIRILRLLVYSYEDAERAEKDQELWQIPAIGTRRCGSMIIKSTILTDLNFENAESNVESEQHHA
jgi:hypothetical protein